MAKAAREAYEQAVAGLAKVAFELRGEGWTEERIARELVGRRNSLKRQFRAADPAAAVAVLERRNLAKYGDPVGPTADQQFKRYGSWRAVIEAACRPSRLSNLL